MRYCLTRRTFIRSLGLAGGSAILTTFPGRSLAAAAGTAPQVVFKFSHGEAADSAQGKTADFFAEAVAKRSNGRIKVDVFPAGQLAGGGDVRVELERVQLGVIDITSSAGTLYFAAFEVLAGASVGKQVMGLKVVASGGRAPNAMEALVRNVSKLYWPLLILDIIIGLAVSKNYTQKYTDKLMNTSVVDA